ncbi:MAG TPA: hypothetical protein VGO03_02835 [Acidimicrobiia bacterium]
MTVTVRPDPFILVLYDNATVRGIVDDVAAQVQFPAAVDIDLTVDEGLPHPILGTNADIVDGVATLWVSGGNFESRDSPRAFSERHARADITHMLLRAKDRVGGGFEAAPPDSELTLGERQAWDTYTWGRVARLGHNVHRQKRLYDFRMQHGFSDASDAAFERLWSAESMTWDGVREICAETGAVNRPKPKTAIDLLRQGSPA